MNNTSLIAKSKTGIYILAETAFSHEGDIDYIKQQIDAAKKGGADGIKFQILLNKDDAYSPNYQVYPLFDKWMFIQQQWLEIFEYTLKNDLEIVVLPIDNDALSFCLEHKNMFAAFEVHSINFNQVPFLEGLQPIETVILGIGGRSLLDIDFALHLLNQKNKDKRIIFMHGFQSFPTNYQEIKMARIQKLKTKYNTLLGYADHTKYDDLFGFRLVEFAYLNGARIFEKHLVLEKGKKRIDYEAAVEYQDLLELRKCLETLIQIQDEKNCFELTVEEEKYKNREKQLVALQDIIQGEKLTPQNIGFKVNVEKSDFEQKQYNELLSKKVLCDIEANQVILKNCVLN